MSSSKSEKGLDDGGVNARLFDGHAKSYAQEVNRSIAASGEDVDYFARRKASEVVRWMRSAGLELPGRALDFGCGTGLSTRALAEELGPRCTVTGIDVSPESLHEARARHASPRARFVLGGDESLPFADASFDLTFTACVFHHIERQRHHHWAHELGRVLRPGGTAFIFEHNPWNPVTVRAVRACPFDEGVVLLRPGYARSLLSGAGMQAYPPRFYFFFPAALRALRPIEPMLARVPIGAQYFVVGQRTARPDAE